DRNQSILLAFEVPDTIKFRHAFERTIQPVVPAVIWAVQNRSLSALFHHHSCSMMSADVIESAQHSIIAANDNDRFSSDIGSYKLTGFFQLVSPSHQLPRRTKNSLGFQFGNPRIGIPRPRNG